MTEGLQEVGRDSAVRARGYVPPRSTAPEVAWVQGFRGYAASADVHRGLFSARLHARGRLLLLQDADVRPVQAEALIPCSRARYGHR